MIRGLALAPQQLPVELIEKQGLTSRLVQRGGEAEYQFLWSDAERVLPVLDESGTLRLVVWGCLREEDRTLPVGRCTQLTTIEAGSWDRWPHQPVDVPCTLALEGSVWTFIREGARGLLVRDAAGVERVYMIVEPASYYYRVMTRGEWMPVWIGERF